MAYAEDLPASTNGSAALDAPDERPVAAPALDSGEPEVIRIRGARAHNLQNVNVEIPRNRLTVLTGLSGSGKSSLAFDTLFAEGQRQYIETLSVYARQFVTQMERPDVDLIEGLQPTISIDQRGGGVNPRSTVATVTEIYDFLRLLYARLGEAHCYQCGQPIRHRSVEQIVDDLLAEPEGQRVILLSPMVRGQRGEHRDALAAMRKAGFLRARIDGQIYELDSAPELARAKKHSLDAVVDRLVIREGIRARLTDAVNLSVKHGGGRVIVALVTRGNGEGEPALVREALYSTMYACLDCGISYEEIEPRLFSFNSPYGACPHCEGLGKRVEFDEELVVPDRTLSVAAGALAPWRGARGGLPPELDKALGKLAGFSKTTPVSELPNGTLQKLLQGDGGKFPGVLGLLEQQYETSTREAQKTRLEAFRGEAVCRQCGGARLRAEARSVRLAGRTLPETVALPVADARPWFAGLTWNAADRPIAEPIVTQISNRLKFLVDVGLDYLTLDRAADTLSGGESQRIRLAAGIGSGVVGVCYVLDEPSIGLHPRDHGRLIRSLRDLQQQGNTVVVVEHDEPTMREADHVIDLGPGAGRHGGRIVALGTAAELANFPESVTGRFLSGTRALPRPQRRTVDPRKAITLAGATGHNLRNVTLTLPLGALVCVTGVSGSGKSTLLMETLARAVSRRLKGAGPKPSPFESLRGVQRIEDMIVVDQTPIGRTPRSNAATYTGAFDEIRKVFAATREAKQRGYKPGRFSFNVAGGRCETCQGQGLQRIEMNFLPDLYVPCPDCQGARFNRQTLQVTYRGRSIAGVLELTVEEGRAFFENFPIIERMLASLEEVGLGYLTLGQASTTLSGGEAQRIKLATELARTANGGTLYILDEPTTGLHFADVERLLSVLQRLVDRGNSVAVIEHNLDVIGAADWIIDLGPEGGAGGGNIIAEGPPEEIAALPDNETGKALARAHREIAGNSANAQPDLGER